MNVQIQREQTTPYAQGSGKVESVQVQAPAPTAPVKTTASSDKVEQSVENVQKRLAEMKETNFSLEYDRDVDHVIVKYTSKMTGELVNQIPSERFVNFEKEFIKTIGLLFDLKL